MKKNLLLVIALLSMTTAYAQTENEAENTSFSLLPTKSEGGFRKAKSFVLSVGPQVGLTFTSMTQPEECNLVDGSGIGFSGGATLRLRFGHMFEGSDDGTGLFGIGLGLKYKQNRVKTIGDDNLSMGYFEVPVVAQVYPFYKNSVMNGFYFEAGLDIAGTLSSSPENLTVLPDNGRYSRVVYSTGDLKGFDLRVPVGIGYTLEKGLDINLRYYFGTSNLAKNMPCKMGSFEISLAWLFALTK